MRPEDATDNNRCAMCTLITATHPPTVTKEFRLQPDGTPDKQTTAHVIAGRMEIVEFTDLQEFIGLLKGLKTDQCLAYGVPPHSPVALVTEREWAKNGYPLSQIARTNKTMSWPAGPGILVLDYDAPKDGKAALSRKQLFQALFDACPELEFFEIVWWPSTSSCIWHGDKELIGINGQRLYLLLNEAQDIPRVGKAILTKLWAQGHGHFEVSKSGSLLERGLFDASVWQTNRIDFAAGAKCHGELTQKRGDPILHSGLISGPIDSILAIADPSEDEIVLADKNKVAQKWLVTEEVKRKRGIWQQERLEKMIHLYPNIPKEQLERSVIRAVEKRDLFSDWMITVIENDVPKEVSVLHILNNPQHYHGMLTLDPLEPDYDHGRPVGKLFLSDSHQCLHSFAHGGATFRLSRTLTKSPNS
ncbi:hypothetical protein [Nitrosomonas communis]|uniref:Uncharacterized protein n=1 Tax=Nitrosomonas communis TaxID=44574 RepID=A0A1I4LMD1_9PROT|nr:hypothetical protein [Nitrosomonas communis]SFL91983.1 hypothetical protein SAMN05421863_10077 [Nitrosomonas communis]